jgi:hypothetical protein
MSLFAIQTPRCAWANWSTASGTREPTESSIVRMLSNPDPDEVKRLLRTVMRGGTPSQPQEHDFYAVALTANSARLVVRSYLETTLPEVQRNLAQWFRWQQLYAGDTPVGVPRLAGALYRKPKNRKGDNQKADNSETDDRKRDDIPAHVLQAYLQACAQGTRAQPHPHARYGAAYAARHCPPLTFPIMGHHAGMPDKSDLKGAPAASRRSAPSRAARAESNPRARACAGAVPPVAAAQRPVTGGDAGSDALLVLGGRRLSGHGGAL